MSIACLDLQGMTILNDGMKVSFSVPQSEDSCFESKNVRVLYQCAWLKMLLWCRDPARLHRHELEREPRRCLPPLTSISLYLPRVNTAKVM